MKILQAAKKGDPAAIERLRRLKEGARPRNWCRNQPQPELDCRIDSFLSFHPPLGKRGQKIAEDGITARAPDTQYGFGLKIFMFVLYLIVIPVLVAGVLAMLMALAIMIMMNLMLLGLWLSVIHWAFGQDWVANYNGFMKFVDDVSTAVSKMKR